MVLHALWSIPLPQCSFLKGQKTYPFCHGDPSSTWHVECSINICWNSAASFHSFIGDRVYTLKTPNGSFPLWLTHGTTCLRMSLQLLVVQVCHLMCGAAGLCLCVYKFSSRNSSRKIDFCLFVCFSKLVKAKIMKATLLRAYSHLTSTCNGSTNG